MTTKTPPFSELACAAVLAVGFSLSPIVYLVGSPVAAASAPWAGSEELRYVAADAAVVMYADVKGLMVSDLRRRLQELRPDAESGPQRFQEETGINLETDVDYLVAAMLPGEAASAAVAVIKGRFDEARIESLFLERGGVPEIYRDARLITERDGELTRALAFLAPGLLAVGEETAVRRAIDAGREGNNVTGNTDLMERIAGVVSGTNVWAVGRLDVLASRVGLPDGVSAQVSAIQWFSASGRVTDGVAASFRAEARDDESAANLRDVFGGFLANARLQVDSRPELQALVESFELGRIGTTVALSFDLPPQFFESLATRLSQPAEP